MSVSAQCAVVPPNELPTLLRREALAGVGEEEVLAAVFEEECDVNQCDPIAMIATETIGRQLGLNLHLSPADVVATLQ